MDLYRFNTMGVGSETFLRKTIVLFYLCILFPPWLSFLGFGHKLEVKYVTILESRLFIVFHVIFYQDLLGIVFTFIIK